MISLNYELSCLLVFGYFSLSIYFIDSYFREIEKDKHLLGIMLTRNEIIFGFYSRLFFWPYFFVKKIIKGKV